MPLTSPPRPYFDGDAVFAVVGPSNGTRYVADTNGSNLRVVTFDAAGVG